jgi:hypothetical protein
MAPTDGDLPFGGGGHTLCVKVPRKGKFSSRGERMPMQGCQMAYFQTKNPRLGKFWRALQ